MYKELDILVKDVSQRTLEEPTMQNLMTSSKFILGKFQLGLRKIKNSTQPQQEFEF